MAKNDPEDTIVAPATPLGEGGIGIVRISGPKALDIADKIFAPRSGVKPSQCQAYSVHYGHIADKKGAIDEVLLTVMRSPKSYTKEDVVEINCHGGIQAVKKVLELITGQDARLAQPGEFTKRAFLNGRIDLVQAEAVLDVIRARTEASLKAAMTQLDGTLSKEVSLILDRLVEIASHIEAAIDFPDEHLDIIKEERLTGKMKDAVSNMERLVKSFDEGVILREGVLAVICGKPNVGKSSLMNLLLKRDRVIVAPVPGTTRDAVEETINIKGVPIRLTDTAGIGMVKDELYKASSKKSLSYIERADIVLLVMDASTPVDEEDLAVIRLSENKKKIVVINKTDLCKKIDKKSLSGLFGKDVIIEISVEKKKNIEALEKAMLDAVYGGAFTQSEGAMVTNARHKELLDGALKRARSAEDLMRSGSHPELAAVDLKEAMFSLGLITGRSVSDEVLDRIFENFCIGK
jgi:tRNA modification GTPase